MTEQNSAWEDIAAQLTEESRARRELAGDVSELGGYVSDLQQHLDSNADALDGLAGKVREVLESMPEKQHPQVDWRTLDDQQLSEQWGMLYAWVHDTLGQTYRLTRGRLHDCWPHHPAVRNQLSWLRVAFEQAVAPSASPGALAEWHVNYLDRCLTACHTALTAAGCTVAKHHGQITGQVEPTQLSETERAVIDRANWPELTDPTPDDQEGNHSHGL